MKHSFILFFAMSMLAFAACQKEPAFVVSGNLSDAKGDTLYFEQILSQKTVCLDSVVLKTDGKYKFSHTQQPYPELYRLRIRKQFVVLAVDSTEQITVSGTLPAPEITGSEKTLQIQALRRSLREKPLDEHKEYARQVIYSDPRSIVAYYALLQTKDQFYILDINDPKDRKCFQAVATSFNAFMPDYQRSKSLYKAVDEVLKAERDNKQRATWQEFIDTQENTFLEISLPDENDKTKNLSQYKGKVILLDFSAVAMEQSTQYFFEIKDLYQKYHAKGLEVYQVSADADKSYWQSTAANLPWITVRPENGAADKCFQTYNVQALPTMFLFNRKGEIVARFNSFEGLETEIEKCLK